MAEFPKYKEEALALIYVFKHASETSTPKALIKMYDKAMEEFGNYYAEQRALASEPNEEV